MSWAVEVIRLATLAPTKKIVATMKIDHHLGAGRYRLILGMGPIDTTGEVPERTKVWTGAAYSNVVDFEVK